METEKIQAIKQQLEKAHKLDQQIFAAIDKKLDPLTGVRAARDVGWFANRVRASQLKLEELTALLDQSGVGEREKPTLSAKEKKAIKKELRKTLDRNTDMAFALHKTIQTVGDIYSAFAAELDIARRMIRQLGLTEQQLSDIQGAFLPDEVCKAYIASFLHFAGIDQLVEPDPSKVVKFVDWNGREPFEFTVEIWHQQAFYAVDELVPD